MARMRFNATRFISIAALQSIAASSRPGRRHYRRGCGSGDCIFDFSFCLRLSEAEKIEALAGRPTLQAAGEPSGDGPQRS
jgi:hypothetical protein